MEINYDNLVKESNAVNARTIANQYGYVVGEAAIKLALALDAVVEQKETNMKTIEWDYNTAIGCTIKEKHESLYLLFKECNKENTIRFVVTSPELSSIFEVATAGFEPSPFTVQSGDLYLVGRLCYNDSPKVNFQLFKSGRAAKDEYVLFSENGNVVIKVLNFINI